MVSSFLKFMGHKDEPQSVELLLTRYQLVAEASTGQHTTLTTNIHVPGGIRTHNLSRRAATDLRLRPRDHWDRLRCIYYHYYYCYYYYYYYYLLLLLL